MEYQRVYITQDNDGHDYVIPYEMREEFDQSIEDLNYLNENNDFVNIDAAEEEFEEKFGKYMTGGDINEAQELYIKK